MKKLNMKIITILMAVFCIFSFSSTLAQDISLLPDDGNDRTAWSLVEMVNDGDGDTLWENYNTVLEEENLSLWEQFSTGIMDRDTILDYVAYLAKLLSQLALLIWALAIIWIWYDKVISSFGGSWDQPIFKVIKGLIVVIFAYFIVKTIYSAFIA